MNLTESQKKLTCTNCHADIVYNADTQIPKCSFCGCRLENNNSTIDKFDTADYILPFNVSKERSRYYMMKWLAQGDYTPIDMMDASLFDDLNGVFLPTYLFSGMYGGNWSASSGYYESQTYSEWNPKTERNVSKSRTVTDWTPSSGEYGGGYSIYGLAINTTNPEIEACINQTDFDQDDLKTFKARRIEGYGVVEYTITEKNIWTVKGKEELSKIVEEDVASRIPGDKYADVNFDLEYDRESHKVYLPFWTLLYKRDGLAYYFCMDGTNPLNVKGIYPVDKKLKNKAERYKKVLIIWLILSVIISINFPETITYIGCGVMALALLIFYRSHKKGVIKKAKASREILLEQFKLDDFDDDMSFEEFDLKIGGSSSNVSEKSYVTSLLLCFFLGLFGAHRFYVGKPLTAVLMLLTFGGFWILLLIDFIWILTGNFKDAEGKLIKP